MPTKTSALFNDDKAGTIYRVAAQMIHEKGFASTSMAEIAEAVELTKPGLYYYVKGKKNLLFAITSFAMDLLDEEVVGPANREDDPEVRLREIVRRHARLLMRDTTALGILIDEVDGLDPKHKEEIKARKRTYLDLVRRTVAEVQARHAGAGRALDPTVAAFSLLGMVMWLSRWFRQGGRLDVDAVADDVTEIAMRSVLAGDAAALPAAPPSPLPAAADA